MRPDGTGRSDRLLNVGSPKVAARLIFEEMLGGGESDISVEVGDIGSGTATAKRLVSLKPIVQRGVILTRCGGHSANMVGQMEDIDIDGTRGAFDGWERAHSIHGSIYSSFTGTVSRQTVPKSAWE